MVNIEVTGKGKNKAIYSNLEEHIGRVRADVLESFLLALACEGFDITDDRLQRALETSVEAIGNRL